jgi:hypothetical protein
VGQLKAEKGQNLRFNQVLRHEKDKSCQQMIGVEKPPHTLELDSSIHNA